MRIATHPPRPAGPALGALIIGLAAAGCGGGGGGDDAAVPAPGTTPAPGAQTVHADVALRDRLGAPVAPGSTTPYSPRQTCGGCHDVDQVALGYHFQQGRTDLAGKIAVKDDYFQDGRAFIRSNGMYGKW